MSSCAEYLQPFLPYIPPDLISAQCLERIQSIAQHLPATLGIGPCMFECSLDGGPAADFSVAAMASRGDHAALARLGSMDVTRPPFDGPGWTRIREFARWWSHGSSLLTHAIEEVWLEFDVCLTTHAPGNTPNLFFRHEYQSPHELALRKRLSGEYIRAATEGLEILEGGRIPSATLSTLAECMDILPAGARILFLGAMIARVPGTVRMVASGLGLPDALHYLRRLGIRESLASNGLIAGISQLSDHLWLAVDLKEAGVSPRIGFDCYVNNTVHSKNNRKWAGLLDFFVDHGVCTDRKRNALLGAADMSNREFDEQAWPESLRRVSKVLGPAGFDRLALYIHHIKVIDKPGVPLEVKAYLCASYR